MAELAPNQTMQPLYSWHSCRDAACFGGSLPTDGATTTWLDKSGNGRDLIQEPTPLALPFYAANQANGFGVIRFGSDGTQRSLNCAGFFNSSSWATWSMLLVLRDRDTTAAAMEVLWDGTAGHWLQGVTRNAGSDGKTFIGGRRTRVNQEFFVYGLTNNGATPTVGVPPSPQTWLDGSIVGVTSSGDPTAPTATNKLQFGRTSAVHHKFDVAELCYWRGPVDMLEFASVQRGLMGAYAIQSPADKFTLICVGNSTTGQCDPGGTGSWPSFVVETLRAAGKDVELYNFGEPSGTDTTLGNQATYLANIVADCESRGRKCVITFFHGHNDLGWSVTVQNRLQNYLSGFRAKHRTVSIACTPNTVSITQPNWQSNQDWHRNSGLSYHDGIVNTSDYPINATYDVPTANTAGYYSDTVHFSLLGKQTLAGIIEPVVLNMFKVLSSSCKRRIVGGGII